MLSTILKAFTVGDIRKKLAFTGAMLLIYRFGAHIPVPSINAQAIESIQEQFSGNSILGLLNTLNGGGLSQFALFALGIMPYITASIILQLLTVVRSEEHTSELQSRQYLVCRLLLEKKK